MVGKVLGLWPFSVAILPVITGIALEQKIFLLASDLQIRMVSVLQPLQSDGCNTPVSPP